MQSHEWVQNEINHLNFVEECDKQNAKHYSKQNQENLAQGTNSSARIYKQIKIHS